jgi:pimeloyl-ACP methyl ester carboxylesterase
VLPVGVPLTAEQIDGFYATSYKPLQRVVLKRIPNAAHMIMWDQPQQFQSEVRLFLQ